MSIIRVQHNRNYVVMNKTGLEDERLSFKAKGILAYLLSKPDNWHCNRKHLSKVGQDGIAAVRSGLKELRENGYLEKRALRDNKGQIVEWESIIREIPETPTQQETAQKAENPPGGHSTRKKSSQHNKYLNLISNDLKTEEEETAEIPQKIKLKFQQIFNRKLSVEFYQEIIKIYSNINIIMKALSICEQQADKPIYLLKILQDWLNNGLKTVPGVNTYLDNRQAQTEVRQAKKQTTAARPETPDEELQRLYQEGYR